MADALLSFGVEKLCDLLVRESERLRGVDDQLSDLKRDLVTLRCFLKDAEAKKHTSATVKNVLNDTKDIVYDTEDIVETFLLTEELVKTSAIPNNVRKYSCGLAKRRRLALDMEAISKRISKVNLNMQILGVQQVIGNQGHIESLKDKQREVRQTFSNEKESIPVGSGLDKNVRELVDYLVKEDNVSQVASISGMGGIGKSTLAQRTFNHETVKNHFEGFAWVCVSKKFTREEVWQKILQQLKPEYKVSEMKEDELQNKLSQVLKTQKTLIVLDDIWEKEDWDSIKPIFPRENGDNTLPGWKVLLTSRHEYVGPWADPNCFLSKPECLNPVESWELFRRKVFPREDTTIDEDMKRLGIHMLEHCGGLPLAIKVLAGLLAAKYTLREWEKVSENIGPHIVGGTDFNNKNIDSVYHVMYLSFEELPNYLKHCFLYLAHFPEDYPIKVETLSYYWAAEEIPRPMCYDGLTTRELGDRYIEELVKRNMVISKRDERTSRFETCKLHDTMRDICLLKAKEENFLQIVPEKSTAVNSKSRRLAVYPHEGIIDSKGEIKNPKIRSLLFIGQETKCMGSSLFFTQLQLMRVLDLFGAEFEGGKLPSSIGNLIHLRYLSLYEAMVTHLPSSLGNLKLMLYLNLNVGHFDPVYVPNFLKEMPGLIYLCLPKKISGKTKLEMSNLVNLETLLNFSTNHSNLEDLKGLRRLETLSILFNGAVECLSSSVSELRHLQNLIITLDEFCRLKEDPMPILEKLHPLKELTFNVESFCGRRMVCSVGGFPCLQNLEFYGLAKWEEWIVDKGSMPCLQSLSITGCEKLEELPDGLRLVTSLTNLSVHAMGREWKLWDLLIRESEWLQEVDEQLKELKRDLNKLKSLFKDADAKKHANKDLSTYVEEIKEIAFDTEDAIETFLLKEELRKTGGIKMHIKRHFCILLDQKEFLSKMGGISKRISTVTRQMLKSGVQQMIIDERESLYTLQENQRVMRKTISSNYENEFVGSTMSVQQLVGKLVKEESTQVVSITGMGGIGKTTLAQQIFNHEAVTNHFEELVWVCLSQQFTRKNVWQTVLQKLRPNYKVSDMSDAELQENICRVLETKKVLIVLDDIWSEEHWDIIKPMFPRGKGWKVLLTSRNEGVGLRADPNCLIFKTNVLSDKDSWTLFRKIAFPEETNTYKDYEEMEDLGRKIIKECGGLPLAIKVVGELLARKYNLHEWKEVYENIRSHIAGGTSFNDETINSVYNVLNLTFEELPIYLKHCFLYLAHFPEDHKIDVEKLSYYWAADGIPRPKCYDGLTIREVGDRYINELVKRNMIISERDVHTSRFETCQLHDMMREFCLLKAEEDNFLQVVHDVTTVNSKSRRVAVNQHKEIYDSVREIKNTKIRSLLFCSQRFRWMGSSLCFTRLQLMRVLDLFGASFEGRKLPSSIGKLIHLRYLSLYQADVKHLPSSLRNLKMLLYLNLDVLTSDPVYMPNFLKKMRRLIYIRLPRNIDDKTRLELGNLVNLETLMNFSTKHISVKDLQGMTRLETLSILFNGGGCTMEALSSSMSELRQLKNLIITLSGDCQMEEDPMPVLEKLVHLKVLTFWVHSFLEKRMVCSAGGFSQLQILSFCGLEEWEEWIVEEGAMPRLHTLTVDHCQNLKELPDGLRFMNSLTNLNVYDMGENWKIRLSEGGEDYHKIQHISSIRLESNISLLLDS